MDLFLSLCSYSGWRVEFRPSEVQLTDFENAAYVVFIVLLTRAILSSTLNLYIPLSKVCMVLSVASLRLTVAAAHLFFFFPPLFFVFFA